MKPSELLVKLKKLAVAAGNNYYQRIAIAEQLLSNRDWITSSFSGDIDQAVGALEQDYFHDLSGSMTLWQLLHIYRKYPKEDVWKKHGYNLRKLYETCRAPREKQTRRAIKVSEFEALEQRLKDANFRIQQLTKKLTDFTKIESENKVLKGRIEELERIVRGKLAG